MSDEMDRLKTALADRYTIKEQIGAGGMATVYLAEDTKLHRKVALKVLRPELAAALGPERFLREIEIAAKLHHPHILPLYDSGEADGFLYYVMPYVEGESLRDRLNREKQLPIDDALQIARDVAAALSYAHSHDVVHRDIKPENILIESGHAVVADFGIAKAITTAGGEQITEMGLAVGTPTYMSPEQAAGGPDLDGRSDLYSLGCVLYEMLSGDPPFVGSTPQAILARKLAEPVPSLKVVRDTIPAGLEVAVSRALARVPADRFSTAHEFTEALRVTRATSMIPEEKPNRTRRSWVKVALLFGVGLVVPIATWAMLNSTPDLPFDKRDWILIANFENETGDSTLDRSLNTALTIAIQQSRHVNVISPARIAEVLQRMQREAPAAIDEPLAREIALREGVAVVIVPTINRLDDVYSLAYRAIDPATGDVMKSRSLSGTTRGQLLKSLGQLARKMRKDLGEPLLGRVQQGTPLVRATTPSLEALRAYTDGRRQANALNDDEARSLYQRAIELDSNFAMAHAALGILYIWVDGDLVNGDEHLNKALALSDRLTERERLSIRAGAHYFRNNLDSAINAYKLYATRFPDDRAAANRLGTAYLRLDRFGEAIATLNRAIEQDSADAGLYINLATAYSASGQPDSALPYYSRAFELQPAFRLRGNLNHEFGFTLVASDQLDEAEQVFTDMLPGSESQRAGGHRSLALLKMYAGRYRDAIAHLEEAVTLMQLTGSPTSELRNRLYLATVLRALGDEERYRLELAAAHQIVVTQRVQPLWIGLLAKLYFRAGLNTVAQEILDTLVARRDSTNRFDNGYLRLLEGERALTKEQHAEALPLLETAYLLGRLGRNNYFLESLAYGYLMSGDLAAAREKYEELITRRELGFESQESWILAHYQLGRISEALADTVQAVEYYGRFLNIWSDGDDELASLTDARTRLQALRGPR